MNSRHNIPATDILASDDAWLLLMDLPGVAQEELNVAVEQRVLTVSTTAEEDAPPRWLRRLTLPQDADIDGIAAKLADGTLSVTIPRTVQTTRRIAVG